MEKSEAADSGSSLLWRQWIDEGHTSVAEIAAITGRGESTVRRWVRNESTPSIEDVRRILIASRSDVLRQRVVHCFFSDLPVALTWIDDAEDNGASSFDHCTDAMEHTAKLMHQLRDLADCGPAERPALRAEIADLVGHALVSLIKTRDAAFDHLDGRKRARPVN